MIICNRTAKWWDEGIKNAIRVRREAYARYTWNETTAYGRSTLRPEKK